MWYNATMDEQEQNYNAESSNVPAPIAERTQTSDDLMIVPKDAPLSVGDKSRTPDHHASVPEYDADSDESMRGGYASVQDRPYKRENRLVWVVIIVMTVMCLVVGICSAFVTAKLMQKGDAPPVINVDGGVQQNISAVVAARKNSIAEVRCGGLTSSGIVMKRDGKTVTVLTNAHAIAQYVNNTTTEPKVRFAGYDDYYIASVKGYDGHYDIAVLNVTVDDGVTVYDIDGSDVVSPDVLFNEGDYVVSIGNAMSLGIASYDGTISRKSELLECNELFGASGKKTVPVFRTTAVINAGMSGCGVFDMTGRLIGLGTYRMSNTTGVNTDDDNPSADVENTGFATPMSIVYPVYKRILDSDGGAVGLFTVNTGKTTSAVGFVDLPLIGFNCEYKNGKLTVKTVSDSGSLVRTGDVITKIGDYEVTTDICGVTGTLLRYHRRGSGKVLSMTLTRGESGITASFDDFRYAI